VSTVRYRSVKKMAYKLQMGPSPAIRGSETGPTHYIKTSLGFVTFHPVPGLEISCYDGRSPVLFLESAGTNLAVGPWKSPTIECQKINSPKTILTVVWNPHGFHLVNVLPKGQKWRSQYYIDHVLREISALRDARDQRKLVVQAGNVKPNVAKTMRTYLAENGVRRTPHLPYSPALAPSDFFCSTM
jgi:hypothetical protein